jgi:TonB family protein
MKPLIRISFLIFLLPLISMREEGSFDGSEKGGADSACFAGRTKAARDIKAGVYQIRMNDLVKGTEYYAEEIFLKYYNLTVTLRTNTAFEIVGEMTRHEETFMQMETANETCYFKYVDSVLTKRFGADIFQRVKAGADSLKKAQPDRYDPVSPDRAIYMKGDSALRSDLNKLVKRPPNSTTAGTVFVKIEVDTNGVVSRVTVVRGVQKDLDAAAVAGAKQLTGFRAPLRRGKKIPSYTIQAVKFTAAD